MSRIIGRYTIQKNYFEESSSLSQEQIKYIIKRNITQEVSEKIFEEKYFSEYDNYKYDNYIQFEAHIHSDREFKRILSKLLEIKIMNNDETVDGLLTELKILLRG
jgi:hypothetical protein